MGRRSAARVCVRYRVPGSPAQKTLNQVPLGRAGTHLGIAWVAKPPAAYSSLVVKKFQERMAKGERGTQVQFLAHLASQRRWTLPRGEV